MLLADTGPLVALIDVAEQNHRRCVDVLGRSTRPMITTWPAFTEAMHLLGPTRRGGGWRLQEALWGLTRTGVLVIHDLDAAAASRTQALMAQYRDAPMALADATLVAAAETLDFWRVFTLDQHFRAYRGGRGQSFEVVPEEAP